LSSNLIGNHSYAINTNILLKKILLPSAFIILGKRSEQATGKSTEIHNQGLSPVNQGLTGYRQIIVFVGLRKRLVLNARVDEYTGSKPAIGGGNSSPPTFQEHSLIQSPGDVPDKQWKRNVSSSCLPEISWSMKASSTDGNDTANKSFWKCIEYNVFKCRGRVMLTDGVISKLYGYAVLSAHGISTR
jgi:hypothetical protein